MSRYHPGVYVCFKHNGYTTSAWQFTSHMMLRHWPWDKGWNKAPIEQLPQIAEATGLKDGKFTPAKGEGENTSEPTNSSH